MGIITSLLAIWIWMTVLLPLEVLHVLGPVWTTVLLLVILGAAAQMAIRRRRKRQGTVDWTGTKNV